MIVIDSRLPTNNFLIYRGLGRIIQGFIYTNLPPIEHEGFRHKSGKVFKRMNFDFNLQKDFLRIRYRSYLSEYEEKIALAILKDGLKLGEIHLSDTTLSFAEHKTQYKSVDVSGCVCVH